MRTVIFDLDGTLADTSGDLIAAANAAMAALGQGVPLVHGQDDGTAFRGGRAMLALGLARAGVAEREAEAAIARGYPILLEAYADAIDTHTRLYPGALEAVERLSSQGYATGICTNKPEGLARLLLERLGVADRFASLVGADTLRHRKPDPAPFRHAVAGAGGDPSRAVLVGDTVTDRDTARAAGAPVILVGFGPLGGVEALAPDAVIGHFDELDAAVRRLIG